jgi:hypothetical protein
MNEKGTILFIYPTQFKQQQQKQFTLNSISLDYIITNNNINEKKILD